VEATAEATLNDLANARSESPRVPPEPLAAPIKRATPAVVAAPVSKSAVSNPRSEPKIARPWYATPSSADEQAPEVADSLLKRFFNPKGTFIDQQKRGPRITARDVLAWLGSLFLKLFPSDRLEPNVMFLLGILVGIGLSAAGLAFFSISKH